MPNCPACLLPKTKWNSSIYFEQDVGDNLPGKYMLLTCCTCGLWFKDFRPSIETLQKHYEDLDVEKSPWDYNHRLPHERKIDSFLSRLPPGSKVLDYGCWTGRLLAPHSSRLKVYGVEPNIEAARIATQNGLEILGASAAHINAPYDHFDCITMVDVFEHLSDPVVTLKELVSIIRPSGRLLIVTGQTNCFPVWLAGSSYWYFSGAEHLIFLNRRFARWLEGELQFVKIQMNNIRHFDFHWAQFIHEFAWLMCWRFLSPHSPFKKPPFYRLPGFKRFERLREPLVCGMWKDHAFLEVTKLSLGHGRSSDLYQPEHN